MRNIALAKDADLPVTAHSESGVVKVGIRARASGSRAAAKARWRSDIGLPDINGYELARRIRAAPWGQDVVLIAATGWGQAADKQRALDAGFDHHLTKPIDFEALRKILASALG